MAKSKTQSQPEAEAQPEVQEDGLLNLRQAAAYLGITDQRVRTVLREGRVEATKNEKGYWRVSTEALDAYNATKGQRKAGGKSYVVRLDSEQKVWLEEQLAKAGIETELTPRYNYDPEKAKAYRLARKEKLAAEAAESEDEAES